VRVAAGRLDEQQSYYAARASEFDEVYDRVGQWDRGEAANAAWQAELARVGAAFDAVALGGDVVELAAGTGYWTSRLLGQSRSITVLDGSAEMLERNRRRLGAAAASVDFLVADIFEWQPDRTWDACVFCFWLCHVPDDRLAQFLHTVAAALRRGGSVCFIDRLAAAEPRHEHVVRTLNDGRRFTIVKHPRPVPRLIEEFAAAGLSIGIESFGSRFCIGHGVRS
jgi:ubiquinone/menaquinone biosynthesis C-methylase UbiE